MKKKVLIIIGIVLVVCALGVELFILLRKNEPAIIIEHDDFIFLGTYRETITKEENYIFKSYDDFVSKFQNDEITENDFINHNYALLKVYYDECSEKDIKPINYEIKGKTIYVDVTYTASCGLCAPQYLYYLIEVSKDLNDATIEVEYHANNNPHCDPYVTYKPMIYLYPEREMKVNVKLGYKDLLTVTYPDYKDGWNVIARPDGKLTDETGRTYYGLYWEGLNNFDNDFKDGFVVKKDNAAKFLEEKLEILGLNETESNEFIVYWLPKLMESEYNLIRFESIEKINEQMPLKVTPAPDTIIRVLMEYKPIDAPINVEEQVLTKAYRTGFTVVEWGGSLIK